MTGAILAVIGAFSFSLSRIFTRRGVIKALDPTGGVIISLFISLPFFFLVLAAMGSLNDLFAFPLQGYLFLSLAGLAHLALGRLLNFYAIQILGANISGIILRVSPIIAVAISVTVLNERLTPQIILGIALIISGISAVSWKPKIPDGTTNADTNMSTRGILFALGAGLLFGISPVLTKIGICEGCSPVAATFISYIAASIVSATVLFNRRQRLTTLGMDNRSLVHFSLSGLVLSIAHTLRYIALSLAPVSIVSPIFATSPVYMVGLSFIFNRRIEVFGTAVIAGVIMTVAGTILLL